MTKEMPWPLKAAKRMVAEAALRMALEAIDKERQTGGPRSSITNEYRVARHLAQHATDQLRLAGD